MRVAFQGVKGAYSELCARQCFPSEEITACPTFDEMFDLLESKKVDRIVLPIENSLEGAVVRAHELLFEREGFFIVGEHYLAISHCLIANPSESLESVKYVLSHPQALGQCKAFLAKHKLKAIPFYDTAAGVLEIKGKKGYAAIASEAAAKAYGMKILAKGIEDSTCNETRFLIIARKPNVPSEKYNKHSIIFSVKHEPGALYSALAPFKAYNINLTRLTSLPYKKVPWKYIFFADFIYSGDANFVIEELKQCCLLIKYLGSYKAERW